jgi:geranylgeranyl diphosphate synthase type I
VGGAWTGGEHDDALGRLLERELAGVGFLGGDLDAVAATLRLFVLEGGKRIRPAFVYWGYRGAGGSAGNGLADAVLRAACAVELLHASALIHDDIMDGSQIRRGRPAVHVEFADQHRQAGWRGEADAFGQGAAILLGDLAFTWADAALASAGLPSDRLAAALPVFNTLRAEMIGGQYLDLLEAQRGAPDEDAVQRVLLYKSGKYTVERPLHMGAAMAGGDAERQRALQRTYSAYGLPLGEAFQLRDDVLGVFGAPSVTGKPAGDDLREGKETFLVLRARALSGPRGRRLLDTSLGDATLAEGTVELLRAVITGSGALAETEARIDVLVDEAKTAIRDESLDPAAREILTELAEYVTHRST